MEKKLDLLVLMVLLSAQTFATGHTVTINSKNAPCNGNSGSAVAIVSGGVGPFSYSWTTTDVGDTLTFLAPGTYTCTVTDNADMSITTASVTITEPEVLGATLHSSPPSACGQNDGSITVSPTGGTLPYSYSWNNGSTNQVVTGLSPDSYTVIITDYNGCQNGVVGEVNNTTGLKASIPMSSSYSIACFGMNNGFSFCNASGGSGNYTYLWSNGSTNDTISNLIPSNYTVTLNDALGCESTSSIIIYEPLKIMISTTTTTSTNGLSNGSASIASAGGGGGSLQFLWSNSVQGLTITGLSCGTYSVTAMDGNGCIGTSTAIVACVTGTNELNEENGLSIYPNPSTTTVTIETTTNKLCTIQLINLLGEIIYSTPQTPISKIIIDVGTLPKGIYIIELKNKETNTFGRQRLIVQ